MIVNVGLKLLNSRAIVPNYQTPGSSGFDLHATSEGIIPPRGKMIVGTGLAVEIPEGYEIQVRPRSGLSAKTNLRVSNAPGTIDSDYRGEIKVILDNIGDEEVEITYGMRIAQGVLVPVTRAKWNLKWDDELSVTQRGAGGLGSTGQ